MQIELLGNPSGDESSRRGGYAVVSKSTYQNLEVAVKVLKVRPDSNLEKINRVSCTIPSLALVW